MNRKRETLLKAAEKYHFSAVLNEMGINSESTYVDEKELDDEIKRLFCDLVVLTPTNQSKLGLKIETLSIPDNRKDGFLRAIFDDMNMRAYYYNANRSNKKNSKELRSKVSQKGNVVFIKAQNGGIVSLYASVRNSIAHGNIVKKRKYYYLFSTHLEDGKDEYNEANITFFMKIDNLRLLRYLITAVNNYKVLNY